jgi:hypothetical protein
MSARSIIDIDIRDEKFQKFLKLFAKFKGETAELPKQWADVSEKFGTSLETMNAMVESLDKFLTNEKDIATAEERRAKAWKSIKDNVTTSGRSLLNTTKTLAKWVGIGGLFSGLIGAGGLYGIDRLAAGAAGARRSAFGLGTTAGAQKAFGIEFSRFINPEQFLGGVNEALHDISQRVALLSAGVPGSVLATGDAAKVGADLLLRLKDLADRTNPAVYAQAIQARGLGGITSIEDLTRLHGMSRREILDQETEFARRTAQLNKYLTPQTLLGMQKLTTQLQVAGAKIESSFVGALGKLDRSGSIEKLSDAVSGAATTIVDSISQKDFDSIARGVEDFAKYVASPSFRSDLKTFVDDMSYASRKIVSGLQWLGLIPDKPGTAPPKTVDGSPAYAKLGPFSIKRFGAFSSLNDPNRPFSWLDIGSYLSKNGGAKSSAGYAGYNNPGNLRDTLGFFKRFETPEGGVFAIANQLQRYQGLSKFGNANTIAKLISLYAPPNENDTVGYTNFVSKRVGIGANTPIDVINDKATLAKIVSAITKMENNKTNISANDVNRVLAGGSLGKGQVAKNSKVEITINNTTGNQASVVANAAAAP